MKAALGGGAPVLERPYLVEEVAALVLVHDRDGRLLHWNRACSELTGYSLDEVRGRAMWEFMLPPQEAGQVQRSFERMRATGAPGRCECWCLTKSGGRRWIAWSSRAVLSPSGELEYIVGTGVDRTEAKATEEAVRFLADASRLLSSSLDLEATLTRVAEMAIAAIADGCVVDLIAVDRIRRLTVTHADRSRGEACAKLQRLAVSAGRPDFATRVLRTRQPLVIAEVHAQDIEAHAQGPEHLAVLRELAPVSVMALPLSARGRMLGVLTLFSSDPGRRYGAHDLWVAEELAHRAALALGHAQLYASAQRAIGARDDTLRIVAHDLRNPLSAARLAANGLALGYGNGIDEGRARAIRRAVDLIERSIDRADRMIEDLLALARFEAGQFVLERSTVSCTELLADVRDTFEPMVTAAGQQLCYDVPLALPDVLADRERLLQVFSNLVGNAIKFTPASGRLGLGARAVVETVCFWVADTGRGIEADQIPHLFERFWQADRGDRRGAGLGLTIARNIVEAHGGRIWVESMPGEGSMFCFTIPMAFPRGRAEID